MLWFKQEGILCAHPLTRHEGISLWTVYVHYQYLQAVFWSWMTYIGCYVPQTCSLRYRGISTMKVNLLSPRCRSWEVSLSFCKTTHRRQGGGWMLLRPNISRTFFEQQEKVSMIIFRQTIILLIFNSSQKYNCKIELISFQEYSG